MTDGGIPFVIAYTPSGLRLEVKQLGEEVGAIFHDVSGNDVAYGDLIAILWEQGESFLLCEHDVLATPALLEEMARCPSPWCGAFAWRYSGAVRDGETRPQLPVRDREFGLFLSKFSADLLRRTPNPLAGAGIRWTQVDLLLLKWLEQQGVERCIHGPVIHLRQQHPTWALTMTEADWVDG